MSPLPPDDDVPPGTGFPVYVFDPRGERLCVTCRIARECGARPRPIEEALALPEGGEEGCSGIALLALDPSPGGPPPALSHLALLKRRSLLVACYADGVRSLPLGRRCEVLLAGAAEFLDSGLPAFERELRAWLARRVRAEIERCADEDSVRQTMSELGVVGESRQMRDIFRWVLRASALTDLPALITGETGTGKEVIANALARLDRKRARGPFVALNCSSLGAGVAESELFGHRRGAFTGAVRDRKGLFRAAEGGVLFLDEIGDLDEGLQAKLLRALQESRVLGVGEDREVSVNVRVIAATNRNLEEMVAERKFRADLFHRLNVLSVHIPPLRERAADFAPLIEHFVKKHREVEPSKECAASPEFVEALKRVRMPGNARQLGNIVRQALFNKRDDTPLGLSDLSPGVWRELLSQEAAPAGGEAEACPRAPAREPETQSFLVELLRRHDWNLARALRHCERVLIETALNQTHGNQSQTASLLGITPRSVYNKVRKHHLS
ncbi:MAG: sigma-54 dependent transcriptional regulator [Acidobacteriota bacterium]|nr:sigma-54 dependent transcriptional regulator [Acidobacteriota bacterium]